MNLQTTDYILDVVSWVLVIAGLVWLVTSVISARHRRAYNLTYAESGTSKKIQPDFLQVDKAKREAAIARGKRYDEELARREREPRKTSPVADVGRWSQSAASAAALVGLAFTALSTFQGIGPADDTLKGLGRWETFEKLVSDHKAGAVFCVAVIASNAYLVVAKMKKSGS
jgi:hypothetical protein